MFDNAYLFSHQHIGTNELHSENYLKQQSPLIHYKLLENLKINEQESIYDKSGELSYLYHFFMAFNIGKVKTENNAFIDMQNAFGLINTFYE